MGPSGPPGGFSIGVGKKYSAHPLIVLRYFLRSALRTPEERLPSGAGRICPDDFSKKIFPWGPY